MVSQNNMKERDLYRKKSDKCADYDYLQVFKNLYNNFRIKFSVNFELVFNILGNIKWYIRLTAARTIHQQLDSLLAI